MKCHEHEVSTLKKNIPKYQLLVTQVEGVTAYCGSLNSELNSTLDIGIKLSTKLIMHWSGFNVS